MKKALIAALCTTVAVGSLAPAFAKDHTLNGFYRVRGMMFNHPLSGPAALEKDQDPTKVVDQRFRVKWDMKLNEFVTTTYFGEIDFVWGNSSYGSGGVTRNNGGALGGDTVNLETKNLYVDVKIPETPVAARVGLQGFADNWSLAYIFGDMAGVKLTTKTQMFDANLGWFKWNEGNGVAEDDRDLFAAQLAFKPMGELKLGADLYWVNDNAAQAPDASGANNRTVGTQADLYYAGLNAAYKLPMVDVSGWFMYNFGEVRAATDMDISGFAGSVKGTFSVAGVKAGLRLSYVSSDDDATDKDIKSPVVPTKGEPVAFADTNLIIMMSDAMGITLGYLNGGLAMDRVGYDGWGLVAINFMADYNPPAVKNVYTKLGVGYFLSLEDDRSPAPGKDREGTSVGTEAALRVGYKFADVADVSLNGSYVWLGDFFDKTAAGGKDPDNLYQVYAMLNINY